MRDQDPDVFNSLLRDYYIRNHYRSAWNEIFALLMEKRDLIALQKLLHALQRSSDGSGGREGKRRGGGGLHENKEAFSSSSIMWYSYLIATAGRSQNLQVALETYAWLQESDVLQPVESTHIAMLNACTASGNYAKFDEMHSHMMDSGCITAAQSAICRLRRYLSEGDLKCAIHVLREARNSKVTLPEASVMSVIKQLETCSSPREGLQFMTELLSLYQVRNERGSIQWTLDPGKQEHMELTAYLLYGISLFDSHALVELMRSLFNHGVHINGHMCGMIFKAIDINQNHSYVQLFYDELIAQGILMEETSYQSLLTSAQLSHNVDFAKRVWKDYTQSVISGRSILTLHACTKAVVACVSAHDIKFANDVVKFMDRQGFTERDIIFYANLILVVSRNESEVQNIVPLLERVKNDPQVIPDWQFFSVMFDTYSNLRRQHGDRVDNVLHVLVTMFSDFFAKNSLPSFIDAVNIDHHMDELSAPYHFRDSRNRLLLSFKRVECDIVPSVRHRNRRMHLYRQLDMNTIAKHIALNVLHLSGTIKKSGTQRNVADANEEYLTKMINLLLDMLIRTDRISLVTDGALIATLAAFKHADCAEYYNLVRSEFAEMLARIDDSNRRCTATGDTEEKELNRTSTHNANDNAAIADTQLLLDMVLRAPALQIDVICDTLDLSSPNPARQYGATTTKVDD